LNKQKKINNRRSFLKKSSLSTIPLLLPTINLTTTTSSMNTLNQKAATKKTPVNFLYDGLGFSPSTYLNKLQEINKAKGIERDIYGNGGDTKALEEAFSKITGKEKAIYLPTGTMANQLAIKLLNGNNTKILVPENSHIFRDEADAAQSVHNKRLIPIGKNQAYFSLKDVENAIEYLEENEVFKSGLGTIVIENPVRRADGKAIPIEEIKAISDYCKQQGYRLHLDGARLHIANAYTNVSISEYAAYFDTVYISLYKYLNATGGAILCGEAAIIDQIEHQIKIYGGTVFQNWGHTAMALHYLEGIEERWQQVVISAGKLMKALNKLNGINVSSLPNGTNIYDLKLAETIDLKTLASFLSKEHNIWLGRANEAGIVKLTVNESLLNRDIQEIIAAWKKGVQQAKQ